MEDGAFTRQRRNLMAISLILLIAESIGIRIETINIFGNIADLDNPSTILYFTWIAWGYFLLRYYQHYSDLRITEKIRTAYSDKIRPVAEGVAWRILTTQLVAEYGDPEIGERTLYGSHVERRRWMVKLGTTVGRKSIRETIEVPRLDMFLPQVRCAIAVALNTRLGTEYIRPYALAVLPVVFLTWKRLS